MAYHEIEVDQALHKLKRRGLPYQYDLNIYRGCSHGCAYCYARKRQYPNGQALQEGIIVKTNIAERLDAELRKRSWQGGIINLGGVCDSYQPAEKQYQLMPQVLQVLIKHRNPVIISTKSDLIVRDRELFDQLGKRTYVNIALCITSVDAKVSRTIEPGASTPMHRFKALKALMGIHAHRALHFFPILPFLSDHPESLETMVSWAAESGVDYMMSAMLYLTGAIRKNYLDRVEKKYPEVWVKTRSLYAKGSAEKDYKRKIHGRLAALRQEYGVSNDFRRFLPSITPAQTQFKLS